MDTTRVRGLAGTAGVLLLLPLTVAPAQARTTPGEPVQRGQVATMDGGCLLERVGTQLVRCDDLTGNGVTAPTHIPQRG